MISATLAFFISELIFNEPYPEFSLLIFQSLLVNPIFFTCYIVLYIKMIRKQQSWATELELYELRAGNKEILKFFFFILQFLMVASVTIVLGALSLLITDRYYLELFFEIMYCARHVSSILLAYGVSNSVKRSLEAAARSRAMADNSLNKTDGSLFESETHFDPGEVMRTEITETTSPFLSHRNI